MNLFSKIRNSGLPYFITSALLVLVVALGVVLTHQTGSMLTSLIQNRMLDISKTAADMLDGDTLSKLTKDDSESEGYRQSMRTLTYFQDNIELKYIYCIRETQDGRFVFSIDPTVKDPGVFGEPVVKTEALVKAAGGVSAVDTKPYNDSWGSFYSAYSPVFTSKGEVGGIVAVDFSADWYDRQVMSLRITVVFFGAVSLLIGGISAVMLTRRNRRRYRILYGQLNQLAVRVDELMQEVENVGEISPNERKPLAETAVPKNGEEIDALGAKILSMQNALREHIELAHRQAYLDSMTGVGNKTAYLNALKLMEDPIREKKIEFAVAIFDMNGLKSINDSHGHECGDAAIIDAAGLLKKLFGTENLYRIGGDEFIAVLKLSDEILLQELFRDFDTELEALNQTERPYGVPLSISKGFAVFDAESDPDYNTVFRRADMAMYADKKAYYTTHRDRRRKYPFETEES